MCLSGQWSGASDAPSPLGRLRRYCAWRCLMPGLLSAALRPARVAGLGFASTAIPIPGDVAERLRHAHELAAPRSSSPPPCANPQGLRGLDSYSFLALTH